MKKPTYEDLQQQLQTLENERCEFKRMAEALRDSNQKFTAVIQASPMGIIVLDSHCKIVLWNPAAETIFGWRQQEVMGGQLPFIPENKRDEHLALLKKVLNGESFYNVEVRRRKKDGSDIYISISTVPLNDSAGGISGVLAVIDDISKRKETEAELLESEKRFRNLAEMLPEAVFETDMHINLTYANQQAFTLFGYTVQDFEIGLNGIEFLVPEDRDKARVNMEKRLHGEKAGANEYRALKKNGETFPILLHANPIIKHGSVTGFRGIIMDITERKEAERSLRESRENLLNILDSMGIGLALISPEMEILNLNRQMRMWFPAVDTEQKNICYRSFNDPPREAICEYCPTHKTLQDGLIHKATTETPQSDGIHNYRIISSPLFNMAGEVIAAIEVVEDITEQKRIEEERETLISDLQQALSEIKTLQGLIPICMYCKKIKTDKGFWDQVETYLEEHTEADFTHGCCPECLQKKIAEFDKNR